MTAEPDATVEAISRLDAEARELHVRFDLLAATNRALAAHLVEARSAITRCRKLRDDWAANDFVTMARLLTQALNGEDA